MDNRIKELEEELENKEIMIKALTNEIKRLKNRKSDVVEEAKRTKIEVPEDKPTIREEVLFEKDEKETLKKEIDLLIHHNRSNKSFGGFLFFDDFIDYCGDTINFNFTATPFEPKGALKTFVSQNYSKVAVKISKEVNKHTLLKTVSTISCISSLMSPLECCIIFHDILVMTQNYSKLHFIFYSLFKTKIDEGLLGTTILSIISHQQRVDLDYLKGNKALLHQIQSLKYPFEIPKPLKTLENILNELTIPVTVFKANLIDENIYQRIFSIRILTHYLDWDYTYNVYCNDFLYSKIDESESFLLYLGIVAFNFYRLFGAIESIECIFEVIKSKMTGVSPTSVLSYLLVKQIDPKPSNLWISLNSQSLIEGGWSIEYLQTYLLF